MNDTNEIELVQAFLNLDGFHSWYTVSQTEYTDLNYFNLSNGKSSIYIYKPDVEPLVAQLVAFVEAMAALELENVKKEEEVSED